MEIHNTKTTNDISSPLIAAENVRQLMSRTDVILIDARGGADAATRYQSGHLAGAIFLDLEVHLSHKSDDVAIGGRHPLPDIQAFARMLGAAGITPATHLVVYDDRAGANAAARFWWMMKAIGHQNVQVADGGLSALEKAGLPILKEVPSPRQARSPYPATGWLLPIADMQTVDMARLNNDWLVVDVRERYRYRGESEPIDLVAGHIPGAVNVPYIDNLDPNGKFRAPEDLAETYKRLIGARDASRVIVHCGSGVTACHSMLAMAVAGLNLPALYVGSWSEWSRNDKLMAKSEHRK